MKFTTTILGLALIGSAAFAKESTVNWKVPDVNLRRLHGGRQKSADSDQGREDRRREPGKTHGNRTL